MFCIKQDLPINEQIRAREVQIITDEGEKIGPISIHEALDMAYDKKLDLVLVAPNSEPPIWHQFSRPAWCLVDCTRLLSPWKMQ